MSNSSNNSPKNNSPKNNGASNNFENEGQASSPNRSIFTVNQDPHPSEISMFPAAPYQYHESYLKHNHPDVDWTEQLPETPWYKDSDASQSGDTPGTPKTPKGSPQGGAGTPSKSASAAGTAETPQGSPNVGAFTTSPSKSASPGSSHGSLFNSHAASPVPAPKTAAPKGANPLGLYVGFEWTVDALALLAYWQHIKKKGFATIAQSGDFPGQTTEALASLYGERRVEIRAAFESVYGPWTK